MISLPWNLKHDTDEHIYETEAKARATEKRLVVAKGKAWGKRKKAGIMCQKHI